MPTARVTVTAQRLWDDLATFSAPDTEVALRHALQTISSLIGAQQAFWIGAVRLGGEGDALKGWRVRAIARVGGGVSDQRMLKAVRQFQDKGMADPVTIAQARESGVFRVRLLAELAPPGFSETPAYDLLYRQRGITDAIFAGCPINEDAESYFGFYRSDEPKDVVAPGEPATAPSPPFSSDDRDTVAYALRPLRWFYQRMMLHHGLLVASAPLTAIERRLASLLMTDRSEKQIAADAGLTLATTHTYITALFRKFGVSGRPGLSAVWLGDMRGGGPPGQQGSDPL